MPSRRALLLGSAAWALTPGCSEPRPGPANPPGPTGLDALTREYEDLMAEHGLAEWSRYAGTSRGGDEAQAMASLRSRERQAVAQYQKTLQEAFREVREAVIRQDRSRAVFEAEGARVKALEETVRLAKIRYDNGRSSQLEVIDAERNLLQAQLNRIEALRAQRAATADLVKALGGGWKGFEPAATAASASAAQGR